MHAAQLHMFGENERPIRSQTAPSGERSFLEETSFVLAISPDHDDIEVSHNSSGEQENLSSSPGTQHFPFHAIHLATRVTLIITTLL